MNPSILYVFLNACTINLCMINRVLIYLVFLLRIQGVFKFSCQQGMSTGTFLHKKRTLVVINF